MMSNGFWKAALACCGIAGLGAFIFWSLNDGWLRLSIFSALSSDQTFYIMILFLLLVFLFAFSTLVAWFRQQRGMRRQEGMPAIEVDIDPGWSFIDAAQAIAQEEGAVIQTQGFLDAELRASLRAQVLRASTTLHALNNLGALALDPVPDYSAKRIAEYEYKLQAKRRGI